MVVYLMFETSNINIKMFFENPKLGLDISLLEFILIFIITAFLNLKLIKQCIRAIKFSMPKNQLKSVAKTVVESLCDAKIIKTDYRKIKITSKDNKNNVNVEISVDGVTTHENNLIINSLKEVFFESENQRYIIVNKKKNISTYYNVPSVLAINKEFAEKFHKNWKRFIGDANLIYTKSVEGRKILLKARISTFNYCNIDKFLENKKPISNWK